MNKNSATVENKTNAMTLEGKDSRFNVNDHLLFLTDLEDLTILGTNLKGRFYLQDQDEELSEKSNVFYRSIIHPEDYEKFIDHLESCRNLSPEEERMETLKVKTPSGIWQDYSFSNRHYKGVFKNCVLGIGTEITGQEQGQEIPASLEKSPLESYKIIMNALDDAFCRLDVIFDLNKKPIDYLFLETNPAFQNHVTLPNSEWRTMRELVPDHEEHWFEYYGKVALTGKPMRFQEYSEKINQTWFNVYAFPLGPEQYPQVAVLFSDITKGKLKEKKLKEINELLDQKVQQRTRELKRNSELLQTIFDTTNQGIVVYEPIFEGEELVDFRYLRVNKIIENQYNSNVMVGKRYLEVNPDGKEIGLFDALKSTMLTGKSKDFEIFYDKKGYNNWFRITARRKNGLLIASMEDITRRKVEAERLKENIRFKKHLTSASPDIIMIVNLYDENIRYINRDMAPVKGMKKKDILGKKLMDVVPFIHPRDREKSMDFHNRVINASDRDVLEMEFRLRSDKGKYTWYNVLGKVFMRNKKAKVYEYMILLRNIDQQIETQKALINAEKLSIKGEIARTLAHELRNPLASIGMASDLLQNRIAGDDQQAENYIKIIKRSSKVLNELVTELLTSSNYSPVVLEKHCLAAILEDSLKMAQDRIYLSGIKIKKKYSGNYYILADEEKLKIALLNLIVNASEAMEPDEGVLELTINKSDDTYVLSVSDNGCGLEKDQLEKLFDAFYTQKSTGVGIGLSSVKTILEEHDATIDVHSEPKKGTIFRLSFQCHENFERS